MSSTTLVNLTAMNLAKKSKEWAHVFRNRSRQALFLSAVVGSTFALVALLSAAQVCASEYEKKATWSQTMLAARAGLAVQPKQDRPVRFGPWYATGPLDSQKFGEALFPEQGGGPTVEGLMAKDPKGKPVWQKQLGWIDGQIHQLPGNAQIQATYLFRTITADKRANLLAIFGSDDGLVVWLNGEKIIDNDIARGIAADGIPCIDEPSDPDARKRAP